MSVDTDAPVDHDRGGPPVDHRIEARRAAVARREGLRRLWIVAVGTAVAALAVGVIAITNSAWLDVETVRVVGADRALPAHIRTASGLEVGQPLVDVDATAAADAVEAVPWVAEATVERSWGGEVTITVSERRAVVALPTGGRYTLVDGSGRQLEVVDARPPELIPVVGVEASGVPGQPVSLDGDRVVAVVAAMTPTVRTAAISIEAVDGEVALSLTVGGRALIGDDRQLAEKMVALETILDQVDLSCLATVDVRVPSAPTVRRVPPSPAADQEPGDATGGC